MSEMSPRITLHLATDHAGFLHKEEVKKWLLSEGYTVVDHGATSYDENDDFPAFIHAAAAHIHSHDDTHRGIIFGGSGQGEAMMANRISGIRATVYYGGSEDIVVLSRQHNNANVLSIGARFVTVPEAKQVIWTWLHTDPLPEEKYGRRNQQIEHLARTHL
jgi:ribose 5-phosphate isomerase B